MQILLGEEGGMSLFIIILKMKYEDDYTTLHEKVRLFLQRVLLS